MKTYITDENGNVKIKELIILMVAMTLVSYISSFSWLNKKNQNNMKINKHKSDFFGEIDFDKNKDYYEAELAYKNRTVELDLNINKQELPNTEQLQNIDAFIKNLKNSEIEIRKYIDSDFLQGGISKEYFEHYTEEYEAYELDNLVEKNNKDKSIEEQLLSKIYIHRVGFYPNENVFAIFDFHVNHEISDQILVVVVENDMKLSITWES